MVGASLIAVFAVAAVVAGPAMAKDPYNENTWGQYKACPYEEPYENVTDCFAGITAGGPNGGFFEYGHIKVKLNQSIKLQGGFKGGGSGIEVVPATDGYETLEAPELKVSGGINVLTKQIQQETQMAGSADGKLEGSQEKQRKHRLRENRNGRERMLRSAGLPRHGKRSCSKKARRSGCR